MIPVGRSVIVPANGTLPNIVLSPRSVFRIKRVLEREQFDLVHVHEPFAPSTSSVALRHSRALNVGSFHHPTENVLATQVARRFVEVFFGRLDARIASYAATARLMESHFPAPYRVVLPMIAPAEARPARTPALRIASTQCGRPSSTLFTVVTASPASLMRCAVPPLAAMT